MRITARIVDADLNVKPVPKHVLRIIKADGTTAVTEVSTNFDGTAGARLAPGEYRLHSKSVLEFQKKTYRWDLAFTVGAEPVAIDLSNDNAEANAVAENVTAGRITDNLSGQFKALEATVFTVWSEFGHGTGFLIDGSGLLLTNQHVIGPSRKVSVQFDAERKIAAVVLAADAAKDVAVLWADVESIEGIKVAPLATNALEPPAVEGERVFTIGSPFSQRKIMTTGIVSRIEERAIISDININSGNSGGPLFNSVGKVIGITTFAEDRGTGPGISGIVRIEEALPLIERARQERASTAKPPSRALPVEPKQRFPVDSLKAAVAAEKFDMRPYAFTQDEFDVVLLTPLVKYHLQGADEVAAAREKDKRTKKSRAAVQGTFQPLDELRNWAEYAGEYKPVIIIRARPQLREGFWSALNRGMAANYGIQAQAKLRFRADFYRMQLLCGDKEIEPIHPAKIAHVVNVQNRFVDVTDASYEGLYTYGPDAIAPSCGTVTLKIYSEKEPDKAKVKTLDRKTVQRVWEDFAAYRRVLEGS
ncbi:MAG TPA: serine protease [Bryobacteraceae bacterium]|nr:serine protease [Bryobacteraceae bacterium]